PCVVRPGDTRPNHTSSGYSPMCWVANATSSNTTSYVRPVCTSPICSCPTAAVPRFAVVDDSESTWTSSSHASIVLDVPFTRMCSSSACQPGDTAVVLVVVVAATSLRRPRVPDVLTNRYPSELPDASRNRSRFTWLDELGMSK